MGITESEAKAILSRYWNAYPRMKAVRNQVEDVMRVRGYIRNMYGRRRRIEGKLVYKSFNSLIQGAAADMIKNAMVKVWNRTRDMETRTMLQIHDELVVEIPNKEKDMVDEIKEIMENESSCVNLRVHTLVDVKVTTTNWAESEEL